MSLPAFHLNRAGILLSDPCVTWTLSLDAREARAAFQSGRAARRAWAEQHLTGYRMSFCPMSGKPGDPYGPERAPTLYRMVFDCGPVGAWYYCHPMTWEQLLDDIKARRLLGNQPGHVVVAGKPDPYALAACKDCGARADRRCERDPEFGLPCARTLDAPKLS